MLRRSTRLLITLSAVAALLVAGGIAAASLLGERQQAAPEQVEPGNAPAPPNGWHTVTDPDARLAFDIPADWKLADADESLTTSNGVRLGHLADWGRYTCQGAEYGRAFAASGVVPAGRKPARAASELAASVAADQYSDGHQTAAVTVSKPQPLTANGAQGAQGAQGAIVHAEAVLSAPADDCAASKGTITVVALATASGNSVLVVGADAVAGPEQPTPLAEPERLSSIVSSLRATG